MSALVLDAGAFVAVDRGDRTMAARLRVAQQAGLELRSTGVVISQVWRDPSGHQVRGRAGRGVDRGAGHPRPADNAEEEGAPGSAQTDENAVRRDAGPASPRPCPRDLYVSPGF